MKPKQNYKDQPIRDQCQTPPHAFWPLLRYVDGLSHVDLSIWEPACGEGYLLREMEKLFPHKVVGTDILTGTDFFTCAIPRFDVLITNPPFSQKYQWITRCYELGKPWALLMPLETLGAQRAQKEFKNYGMELLVLNRRVNFKMPDKGWEGSAQFPVAWFTHGLGIGRDIAYADLPKATPGIYR